MWLILSSILAIPIMWDQDAPSLEVANSYVYRYVLNTKYPIYKFNGVVCSGQKSPFVCKGTVVVQRYGTYTINITAETEPTRVSTYAEYVTVTIGPVIPTQPDRVVIR